MGKIPASSTHLYAFPEAISVPPAATQSFSAFSELFVSAGTPFARIITL